MTWRSRLALFITKANVSSKPCHPSCTVDVFQITRTPLTPLRDPTMSFLSSRTLASSSPRNGSSGSMSPRRCLLALLLSSVFSVSGDIFVKNQLKVLVKVGSVDFQQDDSQGNSVLAHLQRHGTLLGLPTPLANEGYSPTNRDISTAFSAPLTNEPYLKILTPFAPTPTSPTLLRFLLLLPMISGRVRLLVDISRPWSRRGTQIVSSRMFFLELCLCFPMVIPDDDPEVKLRHIACATATLWLASRRPTAEARMFSGSAEVAQPTTVYVFTGQGSQEPGMGMDLYNSSPAARAVWEGADAHLLAVYGFSNVEIVKDNSQEKTIHFGGIKGQAIRQRYMDMTYNKMGKDGHVKTSLFSPTLMFVLPCTLSVTPTASFSLPNSLRSLLSSLRRRRSRICACRRTGRTMRCVRLTLAVFYLPSVMLPFVRSSIALRPSLDPLRSLTTTSRQVPSFAYYYTRILIFFRANNMFAQESF